MALRPEFLPVSASDFLLALAVSGFVGRTLPPPDSRVGQPHAIHDESCQARLKTGRGDRGIEGDGNPAHLKTRPLQDEFKSAILDLLQSPEVAVKIPSLNSPRLS
eukprot:s2129_g8.t1